VEEIFARCLRPSPSVDLWKFYLDYIRRVNPIEGDRAKDARALIGKSFEFALQHVGQDRRAGEMWTEYIEFLKQSGDVRFYPFTSDLFELMPEVSGRLGELGKTNKEWTPSVKRIKEPSVFLSTMSNKFGKITIFSRTI
jgi:hypothetical protein